VCPQLLYVLAGEESPIPVSSRSIRILARFDSPAQTIGRDAEHVCDLGVVQMDRRLGDPIRFARVRFCEALRSVLVLNTHEEASWGLKAHQQHQMFISEDCFSVYAIKFFVTFRADRIIGTRSRC
jgi:hypothetical protein